MPNWLKTTMTMTGVIALMIGVVILIPGVAVKYKVVDYFIEYKEYFKVVFPILMSSITIFSTWFLFFKKNEYDKQEKLQEKMLKDRPKFMFEDSKKRKMFCKTENKEAFLEDVVVVNTETYSFRDGQLLLKTHYIDCLKFAINRSSGDSILIDYTTSCGEKIICLYHNTKFSYFFYELEPPTHSLVNSYINNKKRLLLNDQSYFRQLEENGIIEKVKSGNYIGAITETLSYLRAYSRSLDEEIISKKLELVNEVLVGNIEKSKVMTKPDRLNYMKGNLIQDGEKKFQKKYLKKITNKNEIDIGFMIDYLNDIIILYQTNQPIRLEYILRNIEFYFGNYFESIQLNESQKRELLNI